MILQCPECNARFLVPDQAIGTQGRTVRCGKCAHDWFQQPAEQAKQENLPDLNSLIEEINTQPKPKPIKKGSNVPAIRRPKMPLVYLISLPVLSLIVAALFVLVAIPSMYGLPSSRGMVLADVGVLRVVDKDKHVSFQINGKIANTTAHDMKVPILRITLVDKEGISLQYWDIPREIATLEAGKDVAFSTGNLTILSDKGTRFVTELGSPLELALRRKPQ